MARKSMFIQQVPAVLEFILHMASLPKKPKKSIMSTSYLTCHSAVCFVSLSQVQEKALREHVIIEGKVWREHGDLTAKVVRGCKPSTMGHRFARTPCRPTSAETPEKIIASQSHFSLASLSSSRWRTLVLHM